MNECFSRIFRWDVRSFVHMVAHEHKKKKPTLTASREPEECAHLHAKSSKELQSLAKLQSNFLQIAPRVSTR